MAKRKWSNEELLDILRCEYNKNNNITQYYFIPQNDLPHYHVYYKHFGGWEKAKKDAGLPNHIKNYNISKNDLKVLFINFVNEIGHVPNAKNIHDVNGINMQTHIRKYYKTYDDFLRDCGLFKKRNVEGHKKYKMQFLTQEIQRFVFEYGRIPTQSDFENLKGYPSRKTFSNHFGTFNNALKEAGYKPVKLNQEEYNEKYKNKDFISKIMFDYIDKYDRVPMLRELEDEYPGLAIKHIIQCVFKTYNNALTSLNLKLNAVSQYSDDFLQSEINRFVKENGRVPRIHEFNNSEYPSFWCYQSRFGSWNNAIKAYGYKINDSNRKYILDNGEICCSSYEHQISTWLMKNNIRYERDIKYCDFIDNYKGKMNCDYKIYYNNEIWYVEMAGFYNYSDKRSKEETMYSIKLSYKKKLLKRQGVNYLIIYPRDINNKKLEDIFYFINIQGGETIGES